MIRIPVQCGGNQGRRITDDHQLPAEALTQQFVGLLSDTHAVTRCASEKGRRPRTLVSQPQVPSQLHKCLWHLLLWDIPDETHQFFTFSAHTTKSTTTRRITDHTRLDEAAT